MTMGKFTQRHEEDLGWYYRNAAGDLGMSSSLGPMINMAMSGISQGGKAISQHTPASMDAGSPVERQREVAEIIGSLDAVHQRTLAAFDGDRRGITRPGDSPKEAGEWMAILTPAERLFGELATVVIRLKLADSAALYRDRGARFTAPKGMNREEAGLLIRETAARVADAKRGIAKAERDATRMLAEAREAYGEAARALPPRKARRSLDSYKAWLAGGGV